MRPTNQKKNTGIRAPSWENPTAIATEASIVARLHIS